LMLERIIKNEGIKQIILLAEVSQFGVHL
jgi:hypothetical protein